MKRSSGLRKTGKLSDSVNHQLNMYALAASAAGVATLALVPAAGAKVIYTAAHKVIPKEMRVYIDLNRDGINDLFFFMLTCSDRFCSALYGIPLSNNLAWATGTRSVAALHPGKRIGPSKHFQSSHIFMVHSERKLNARPNANTLLNQPNSTSCTYYNSGPWLNVKNRYLGLQFIIKGKTHYGWARLNVTVREGVCPNHPGKVTAILTGYAYETIPGKAIIAGSTEGPDDDGPDNDDIQEPNTSLTAPTPQPATLGMLALGAPALSIWRREENPSPISIP